MQIGPTLGYFEPQGCISPPVLSQGFCLGLVTVIIAVGRNDTSACNVVVAKHTKRTYVSMFLAALIPI